MRHLKSLSIIVTIAVATFAGGAAPATAQNFVWSAGAGNDPANGGRYTATLRQAVPETDNVAFDAQCTPRGQYAVISYNTGTLPPGKKVVVDFFRNGKKVYSKTGAVYQSDSEEGIAGVQFDTTVNDSLWSTLSHGKGIKYQIGKLGKASMHLRGSTSAIKQFRRDCGDIVNASNGAGDDADNEENNVASAPSCRDWGRVKSTNADQSISIRFVNNTQGQRGVMWLDYQGQPKQYKDLAPGESYVQQTYVGHPWMFTDGPGNCKEIFTPVANAGNEFAITFDD